MTKEEWIAEIKKMTVLELHELVEALKEEFGVTAAAPMMMAGVAAVPAEAAQEEEEQTEFDVILSSVGQQKIQVIKVVRELTSLGLKEAKDLVDNAPKPVLQGVPKEEAEKAKAKLEEVGAAIEIK